MKDAASEANLTVVGIILIAIIAGVVTPIINNAMSTTQSKADCLNKGGNFVSGKCDK